MKLTDKAEQIEMEKQRSVIAIIDDNSEIRAALEELLSFFGYRVEAYSSAEEFVAASITTEASCLLLDIQLGDITGIELARQLSATGFRFPIIFMTASQEERHRRQALDFGCVAYLLKPFHVSQLIEAITKAIGCAPGQENKECQNGA